MDQYVVRGLQLAELLTEKEVGKPKSLVGVTNIVFSIVEEVTRRYKTTDYDIKSVEFKKELTIRLLRDMTLILKRKGLIDERISDLVSFNLNNENVDTFLEFVDDIREIWDSELLTGCLCFKKKKKDKLKKLKIASK